MTPSDQLRGGSERDWQVPRRWLVVAGAAAALLAGADRLQLRHENVALLRCVESAQSTLDYGARRVAAIEEYASPQLGAAQTPEHVRVSLQGLVRAAARDAGDTLAVEQSSCGRPLILPWHGAQRAARTRYLAYVGLRRARLQELSVDLSRQTVAPAVLDLERARARTALLGALTGQGRQRAGALVSP